MDLDAEEQNIQSEIENLRQEKYREKKKIKKKERELAAKWRRCAALGMDLNALEVPDNDKIFSLSTITKKGDLEAACEIDFSYYSYHHHIVHSKNHPNNSTPFFYFFNPL